MHCEHCVTSVTLPHSVTIFGTRINVHVSEVCHGELRNLTESRISLETLILRNHTGKTGFLMWISSYCMACIYQQNKKVKQLFSLVAYEESESPAMNKKGFNYGHSKCITKYIERLVVVKPVVAIEFARYLLGRLVGYHVAPWL